MPIMRNLKARQNAGVGIQGRVNADLKKFGRGEFRTLFTLTSSWRRDGLFR
jgi:hypothetical protein